MEGNGRHTGADREDQGGIRVHLTLLLLREREEFLARVNEPAGSAGFALPLVPFIVTASALYGAAMGIWRSAHLALYVGIKMPLLMIGTTILAALLDWIIARMLGNRLSLRQTMGIIWGAMTTACWILLGLAPVTFFLGGTGFGAGDPGRLRTDHNWLLLIHISLIALAGMIGIGALRHNLRKLLPDRRKADRLYWCWIGSFILVGGQLSWILRPFVGSPFYPVAFIRPDAFSRNFFEFLMSDVLPHVLGIR